MFLVVRQHGNDYYDVLDTADNCIETYSLSNLLSIDMKVEIKSIAWQYSFYFVSYTIQNITKLLI